MPDDDDNDKTLVGSDPKADHASALELDGEFFINGLVTPEAMLRLSQSMLRIARLRKRKASKTTFTVNINTPGGSVAAGLMLGAVIMRIRTEYGIRVNTRVLSEASSMGCIILQFGELRQADRWAVLMLHDIQGTFGTGDTRERAAVERCLAIYRRNISQLLAERNTKGKSAQWWMENYLDRSVFMSAADALAVGLVDEVTGEAPQTVVPPPDPTRPTFRSNDVKN